MECKKCGSSNLIKGGFSPDGTQRYLCRDCGSRQVFSHRKAGRPQKSHPRLKCVNCKSNHLVKNGFNDCGNQLWKCKDCGTRGTFRKKK